MTLNLPLLYCVWTEEYCQTSPNKNKTPNLWHVTSILVCCIFACLLLETRYPNVLMVVVSPGKLLSGGLTLFCKKTNSTCKYDKNNFYWSFSLRIFLKGASATLKKKNIYKPKVWELSRFFVNLKKIKLLPLFISYVNLRP